MDDMNDIAHQTNYGLSIPTTWTPSDVLFRLVNELKSPIKSVEGYAKILSEIEVDSSKSIAAIQGNVKYIDTVLDAVRVYLMETGYLPREHKVMIFLREKVFDPIVSAPQTTNELKQEIIRTVQSFNQMDYQRIVSAWINEISKGKDTGLIQKMISEGFTYHQDTLNEFQERFTKPE
jgi:hypothetical protein